MSFAGLLINKCDIVRKAKDKYGRLTGETVTPNVRCRWEHGLRRVIDDRGEEVLATALVFFSPAVTLNTNCFLRYGGTEYKVVKVFQPQNSTALHHVEVFVV